MASSEGKNVKIKACVRAGRVNSRKEILSFEFDE